MGFDKRNYLEKWVHVFYQILGRSTVTRQIVNPIQGKGLMETQQAVRFISENVRLSRKNKTITTFS